MQEALSIMSSSFTHMSSDNQRLLEALIMENVEKVSLFCYYFYNAICYIPIYIFSLKYRLV